jgi:hypothetical protein
LRSNPLEPGGLAVGERRAREAVADMAAVARQRAILDLPQHAAAIRQENGEGRPSRCSVAIVLSARSAIALSSRISSGIAAGRPAGAAARRGSSSAMSRKLTQ